MKNNISKYLSRYACPEVNFVDFDGDYDNVLVIPLYAEFPHCIRLLNNLPKIDKKHKILLILVINQSNDSPSWVLENNQKLINYLNTLNKLWQSPSKSISLHKTQKCHLLVVDRALINPFEEENVGHARKIGTDIALSLIQKNIIRSQWIHQTDGDVILPDDYWNIPDLNLDTMSALVYPFSHCTYESPDENSLACMFYEISIRDYRIKLFQAGSLYAHQSIGSTLAISAQAYAKVRGYPLRQAGEDFHILNKLRKVGLVYSLATQPILVSSRVSTRTPFGTGQNILRILQHSDLNSVRIFHNPIVFKYLMSWLQIINNFSYKEKPQWDIKKSIYEHFDANNQKLNPELLYKVVQDLNLPNNFSKLFKQSTHSKQFRLQCHTHFDALKTLRFLHLLRDQSYPLITLRELLNSPPYLKISKHLPIDEIISKIRALDMESRTDNIEFNCSKLPKIYL